MAEAILTGKEVKEFSFHYGFTSYTSINTIVFEFTKNFFVGHCPCNTGNRYGQNKKPKYLYGDCHGAYCIKYLRSISNSSPVTNKLLALARKINLSSPMPETPPVVTIAFLSSFFIIFLGLSD
jgi:hypothetical protein